MPNNNHEVSADYASLFASSPTEENKIDALVLAARFLEILNYALEDKKMTRRSLAEAIGTSPSWLTQLFRGDRIPNLEILASMAKKLDISFEVRSSMDFCSMDHIQPKSLINTFRELEAKKMEEVRLNTLNAFYKPKWDTEKPEIDEKEQEEFEPYSMTA
jgi:transcriptional regulator with XRE-family HTH domain